MDRLDHSMSVALVAQVGSAALTLLLYQVIAPELPGVLAGVTLDKTREMMEGFGMSGDMLNAQMKEIKEAMDEAYTLKGLAKNSAGMPVGRGVAHYGSHPSCL